MIEVISAYVAPDRPTRILDIGCGTGATARVLAESLPNASIVGVDISEPNIRQALARWSGNPGDHRVQFVVADYMSFRGGRFDLILADSVLHLIHGVSTLGLFRKIADELTPGGMLVVNTPYDCRYNRALWLFRRALRAGRSQLTDAVILSLARRLYGRRVDDDLLRDCIPLMYTLPNYRDSQETRRLIVDRCGLDLRGEFTAPHTSVAQAKHRIVVFQKPNSLWNMGTT